MFRKAARPHPGVSQLDKLYEIASRVREHGPARAQVAFNAPGQFDLMGAKFFHAQVEIVHLQREDRKACGFGIQGGLRFALQDDKEGASQRKVRAIPVMRAAS